MAACFALPGTMVAQQPALRIETDVSYGIADGKPLLLDVYRLPDKISRPAIVFVHGGGWTSGDKSGFSDMAQDFARRGFVCFAVNYRLVTEPPAASHFPDQLDDIQRAVRWILAHAATYGIEPKRIGALGGSAGGQLAALLGEFDTRDNRPQELSNYSSRVQCVVDMYGPADLTTSFTGVPDLDVQALVNLFLGGTVKQKPDVFLAASPIFHIDSATAQFLIFHGTDDPIVPVEQSRRFAHALQEKGIPVTYIEFPGEQHGFVKPADVDKFASASTQFFDSCLKRPAT